MLGYNNNPLLRRTQIENRNCAEIHDDAAAKFRIAYVVSISNIRKPDENAIISKYVDSCRDFSR